MKESISVIGLGKLGLCTAGCFAKAGYDVIGVDICKDYVKKLETRKTPFHEEGLQELLTTTKEHLSFTTSLSDAIEKSDASFIIVPTPSKQDGAFDNQYIIKVLQDIAPLLANKTSFHIVNIVSTVMPGSCHDIFIPLLERTSGKKAGKDFGVAYNPEFIAIGTVISNFLNPDIVLIGESDDKTGKTLEKIYNNTCDNTPHMARTSLINAEISKLALNCYCTMKISFANNIASLCDTIPNSDANQICKIIGQDSRVGEKYIAPGLGFGGPCFPRDNEAFIQFTENFGHSSNLQKAVVDINNGQLSRAVNKIIASVKDFGGNVALLGLAYKPDTYLTEESQALAVAHKLANYKAITSLRIFDFLAQEQEKLPQKDSLEECVRDAQVVAILTPCPEFFTNKWHHLLNEKHIILNFWK